MYWFFVLGGIITSILPRAASYKFAKFLALLNFYFSKKDRDAVTYNLSAVVGDAKKVQVYAREVFINFSYYLTDFFRSYKIDHDFIKKYVKIENLEYLDSSFQKGKGVITVTAHLGNYELAGAVVARLGYPISVVALPHKDKRTNVFFDKRRKFSGMQVIPTGVAIKGCLSALRRGEIIALLGDRDFSKKGKIYKMFSRDACIPRGVYFFSHKTEATVIPCFLIREDVFFYRFIFDQPIHCSKETKEKDLVTQYLTVLEKYIKKYPGQWYIFEKYWLAEKQKT